MCAPSSLTLLSVLRPLAPRLCFVLLLPLLATACLAGPSTAIGGGPIGLAPNLRRGELLREPDSTRGVGFVIISNRRDLIEETRVELNAAARAFDRMLGARPDLADVRLVSDASAVQVSIRTTARPVSRFGITLEGVRPRVPESLRVASVVVLATSREWLFSTIRDLVPADTSSAGWMERDQIPLWLRVGVLQNVAVNPLHELWMIQLGRQRDSLPTVASLFSGAGCDAACLGPFARVGSAGSVVEGDAFMAADVEALADGARPDRGRGRLPALDGRARFAAATYSLVQFIAEREGPAFMRTLLTTALTGGDVRSALGSARSFTADPADIDRQWRVWLATFAYPDSD